MIFNIAMKHFRILNNLICCIKPVVVREDDDDCVKYGVLINFIFILILLYYNKYRGDGLVKLLTQSTPFERVTL